jgi:hypothetical protein
MKPEDARESEIVHSLPLLRLQIPAQSGLRLVPRLAIVDIDRHKNARENAR